METWEEVKHWSILISAIVTLILLGAIAGTRSAERVIGNRITEIMLETKGQEIVGVSEINGDIYITTKGLNCESFNRKDLSASSSIYMWGDNEYKLCFNNREEIRVIK